MATALGAKRPQSTRAQELRDLSSEQRGQWIAAISDDEAEAILHAWEFWAPSKSARTAGDWVNWLVMAGRGFGRPVSERAGPAMVKGIPYGEFSGSNNRDIRGRDGARRGRAARNQWKFAAKTKRRFTRSQLACWSGATGAQSLLFSAEERNVSRPQQ